MNRTKDKQASRAAWRCPAVAIVVGLVAGITGPVAGVTITAVNYPNLIRPANGVLFPFTVEVFGTYTNWAEIGLGIALPAEYWDDDTWPNPNDAIDVRPAGPATGLNVPAAPAGSVLGAPWGPILVTFNVGCQPTGEVFGPSGGTDEFWLMPEGMFRFNGLFDWWGYNTVTCAAAPPTSVPPGPPYPPGTPIPEPGTLGLLALGGLAVLRRRTQRTVV